MTMAKMGAFEDIGCDRTSQATANATGCDVPDGGPEWDQVNNYTGAPGADGLPDAYFESTNSDDLQDRIQAAIASILKRAGSGTNASIVASSTNAEGAAYQAYFYPGTVNEPTFTEVRWVGYLQALWVDAYGNLREDTVQDGKLVLQQDYIVKTQFVYDVNNDNYNKVLVYRYADANGDGKADSATPVDASPLEIKDLKTIWEAGNRLATATPAASCAVNGGGQTCRRILTWWDTDEDGLVDAGEDFEFTAANFTSRGIPMGTGTAPFTTANIVDFIRGSQPAGLRDRQLTVGGSLKVWKLGDIVYSTPTLVGAPRERYDVIYGDGSYTAYFTTWKNRRQVIYAGANDGMLHAFNAGYYHRGDDTSTGGVTEHGWFTRTPSDNSSGPLLGDEKWGFIPYQLVPQLYFLARPDYNHVYYVDLKPKVTDVRIFCDGGGNAPTGCVTGQASTSHPNGWGTILIGGMRFGGSCGSCVVGTGAPTMTLTQDFNGDGDTTDAGDTRTFLTAYFVLDITNPEQDPKLLWSFTHTGLGLSTSYPAVIRANPAGDAKTSYANAKWFMLVGSGATTYDFDANQGATSYAMDLMAGPGANNSLVQTFPSSGTDAPVSMGDYASYDKDLDYRVDVLYAGRNKYTGASPLWRSFLMRLTTNGGNTNPATWGASHSGNRIPTVLLRLFPAAGTSTFGGLYVPPAITTDDARNVWVIFGSGRLYSPWDKVNTDQQYLIGIKDPVMTGACVQAADNYYNCMRDDLVNVSGATVCVVCAGNQVTGVAGVTSLLGTATSTLQGLIQSKDGWYTTLPAARERVLVTPTVYGGTVFVTSFIPINDVCSGLGSANLYALFYQTGSAYKESIVGTYDGGGGNTNVSRSIAMNNVGMWSQLSIHAGAQGTGTSGANNTGGGCQSGISGISQSSSFETAQICLKPALSSWSRYLSWVDQRY
jgi:type IV pilus assembly protein PilY1